MSKSAIIEPDPYAHLYGTIDPSDGIPFRRPDPEPTRGSHYKLAVDRGVYPRPGGRYQVRIRYRGVLYCPGTYRTIKAARLARDKEYERLYGDDWLTILQEHVYRTKAYRDQHGLPPRAKYRTRPRAQRTRRRKKRRR